MDPEDTLVDIIEEVYDRAILKTGRNTFNMAKFLKENNFKKSDVTRFVESGTAGNISCTIDDLDHYIKHGGQEIKGAYPNLNTCLLYTSPSPRDTPISRMPSSA